MHTFVVLATLLTSQPASSGSCWAEIGQKVEFGSGDQVRELQKRAKGTSCDVLVLAWHVRPIPKQQSMLVWDTKQGALYRVHVEGSQSRWERWSGATRADVLKDDPSDGFDLGTYTNGQGRAGLSQTATEFVRSHAAARFRPAL